MFEDVRSDFLGFLGFNSFVQRKGLTKLFTCDVFDSQNSPWLIQQDQPPEEGQVPSEGIPVCNLVEFRKGLG